MDLQSLCKRALALHQNGKLAEAESLYVQVLAAEPDNVTARHLLGVLRSQQGRHAEALELLDVVSRQHPDNVAILFNYSNALEASGARDEALAILDKALALEPRNAHLLNSRGALLQNLNRFGDALANYDHALAAMPGLAQAHYNRALILRILRRPEDALVSLDRAVAIKPDYAGAYYVRGNVLYDLRQFEAALQSYDRALRLQPGHVEPLNNRGNVLRDLERYDQALASYDAALKIAPDDRYAFSGAAIAALRLCDWERTAAISGALEDRIRNSPAIVAPFVLFGYDSSPALQLACAKKYISDQIPLTPPPMWNAEAWHRGDKIRIAYLSGDFYTHATAYLAAGLFEHHDRARFDVHGVSYGPDDGSALRARLIKGFDHFHDVRRLDDREVAKLLLSLQIDIAVDLKGHTGDARPGILSHRPCPVQVNYLGYPGTMGADFLDYIIADETILPFDQQPSFTERIVHLPHCYQANDAPIAMPDQVMQRAEAGLPETGFVFCAFNTHWKITSGFFQIWMRLLASVPGSVLWLIKEDQASERNLRHHAAGHGIDPGRLIFAPKLERSQHLARHQLADLFLDTLPCNAHTTASDALLAGLPLVTCRGETFAGRVAASLLKAIGLPELVTETISDYESLALALALDSPRLSAIRTRLAQNRLSYPLFDTRRFCRDIESAYSEMLKIKDSGGPARSFRVPAD